MSTEKNYLKNLRALRIKKGWTQEKLAQESGISYHTLIKIERGNIKDPRLGTLLKIAAALDVPIEKLINY
jgi:transcriptional regulator with XRE-family HTH domain